MSIEIKNIENSLIYIPEERPFADCIYFLHGIIEDIHLYNNMAMFFAKKNYIVILQEYSWMTKSSDHPYNHIGTVDKYEFPQVFSTFEILRNYVYALPDAGYEIPYYPIGFSIGSYLLRNVIGQGMLTRRRSNIILIDSG